VTGVITKTNDTTVEVTELPIKRLGVVRLTMGMAGMDSLIHH
jgi:hypothetical protein